MRSRPAVIALMSIGTAATALPRVPRWLDSAAQGELESAVTYGAAAGAAVLVGWCAVLSLLALVDPRLIRHLAPRWVVMLVLGGAGAGLMASPAAASGDLDGLRLPDRPVGVTPVAVEQPPPPAHHVVVAGDSLWTIAARHLPPGHGTAQIAAATTAWHERNRDVIGPDADYIVPGQVLIAPDGAR